MTPLTGGPWHRRAPRNDAELLEIVGESGRVVACIPDAGRGPTEAERLANIAAIEAVPELVAAIRAILEDEVDGVVLAEYIRQARVALAKVDGR